MAQHYGFVRVIVPVLAAAAALQGPLYGHGGEPRARQEQAVSQASSPPTANPPAASQFTDAEMEAFLKEGKIQRTRSVSKGITNSTRATLSNGVLTHDAHIQVIDEFKREFRTYAQTEFDFRDSYIFNIAAYRLDRLIGLNMVPVSVRRGYRSSPAAFTWWVDDVMMDEGDRLKKKQQPPPQLVRHWNEQVYMMRLFDQLIYNTDRNVGNMLITNSWRLWAIDHTRAFRKHKDLKTPSHITRCARDVFEKLKGLTFEMLKRELDDSLDDDQIRAILARRDLIVAKLESLGPGALFDRTMPSGT